MKQGEIGGPTPALPVREGGKFRYVRVPSLTGRVRVGLPSHYIRRTPHDMVTVGDSAHGGVECGAAVARGDDDGCAIAAAYGVEELFYKDGEHLTCCTGRSVVDGQAFGGRTL